MTEQTQVSKKQETAAARQPAVHATDSTFVPMVDICENPDAIRLMANMPGVDQKAVDVTVEKGVLTIAGKAELEAPEGYDLVGQEYAVGRFRRDFTLSEQVDTEGIKARMANGVLEVTLPKREEVKMRKIDIAT